MKDEGRGGYNTMWEVEGGLREREGSKKMCQRVGERSRRAGETKTKYVMFV